MSAQPHCFGSSDIASNNINSLIFSLPFAIRHVRPCPKYYVAVVTMLHGRNYNVTWP